MLLPNAEQRSTVLPGIGVKTAHFQNGPKPKRPTFFSCLSLDVNCMQCFYYVCKFSFICSNISHRCLENE